MGSPSWHGLGRGCTLWDRRAAIGPPLLLRPQSCQPFFCEWHGQSSVKVPVSQQLLGPQVTTFPCSKEVLMPTVLLVCLLTTETRCIFTTHIPTIVPRKVVPSLPPYLSLHVFLVPSPDKLSVSAPSHWADDFPKGEGHYCHPCWGLQWGCTGLLHGAD